MPSTDEIAHGVLTYTTGLSVRLSETSNAFILTRRGEDVSGPYPCTLVGMSDAADFARGYQQGRGIMLPDVPPEVEPYEWARESRNRMLDPFSAESLGRSLRTEYPATWLASVEERAPEQPEPFTIWDLLREEEENEGR